MGGQWPTAGVHPWCGSMTFWTHPLLRWQVHPGLKHVVNSAPKRCTGCKRPKCNYTILFHKSVDTTPHSTSRSQYNHPPLSLNAPLPYVMTLQLRQFDTEITCKRQVGHELTPTARAAIAAAYAAGEKKTSVAHAFHVHRHTVDRTLNR